MKSIWLVAVNGFRSCPHINSMIQSTSTIQMVGNPDPNWYDCIGPEAVRTTNQPQSHFQPSIAGSCRHRVASVLVGSLLWLTAFTGVVQSGATEIKKTCPPLRLTQSSVHSSMLLAEVNGTSAGGKHATTLLIAATDHAQLLHRRELQATQH